MTRRASIPARGDSHDHSVVQEVEEGRSARTPFLLIGGVALAIYAVVALVTGVLLLIWLL